jgi:hypothetical protein
MDDQPVRQQSRIIIMQHASSRVGGERTAVQSSSPVAMRLTVGMIAVNLTLSHPMLVATHLVPVVTQLGSAGEPSALVIDACTLLSKLARGCEPHHWLKSSPA